jgi:hypothetical protein
MIRLELSREDALYLLDALNTERFRIQDRASEEFSARRNTDQWLYRLGILDSLVHLVDNELNNEHLAPYDVQARHDEAEEALIQQQVNE